MNLKRYTSVQLLDIRHEYLESLRTQKDILNQSQIDFINSRLVEVSDELNSRAIYGISGRVIAYEDPIIF
jgi:hypothetical protein